MNTQGRTMNIQQMRNICIEIFNGGHNVPIANNNGCSHTTITKFRARLKEGHITNLDALNKLNDEALIKVIYPSGQTPFKDQKPIKIERNKPLNDAILHPNFIDEANKQIERHLTSQVMYIDYVEKCIAENKEPIGRSWYYENLSKAKKSLKGVETYMVQEHPYSSELEIDYTGRKWKMYSSSGDITNCSICVLTWGASYYTYAEIIPQQSTKCTCEAIAHSLIYFGCRPSILLCDNAKSMVDKHTYGQEAIINSSFDNYMKQIGIALLPNNVYSPSQKSAVELSVRLIQQRVLPRMNEELSQSLEESNITLMNLVDKWLFVHKYG